MSKRKLSEEQINRVIEYVNNIELEDLIESVLYSEIEHLENLDKKTFNETWNEYYK